MPLFCSPPGFSSMISESEASSESDGGGFHSVRLGPPVRVAGRTGGQRRAGRAAITSHQSARAFRLVKSDGHPDSHRPPHRSARRLVTRTRMVCEATSREGAIVEFAYDLRYWIMTF